MPITEPNLFYFPYASFASVQLPLLRVAALYFDKLIIHDPVGANWDTSGVWINGWGEIIQYVC